MTYLKETLEIHEDKLKKVVNYLNNRIEELEKRKKQPNLINELKILFTVIEEVGLEGDYPLKLEKKLNSVKERIELEGFKECLIDYEYVIDELIYYKNRMSNDIFSKNFDDIKGPSGIYRIEPSFLNRDGKYNPSFLIRVSRSPLEALISVFNEYGEFHLEDIRTSFLKLTDCPYFNIFKQGPYARFFCSYKRESCFLAYDVDKEPCPNPEFYQIEDPLISVIKQLEESR